MKIQAIKISFKGNYDQFEGLRQFAKLHRADKEWLIEQEMVRQSFNQAHPGLCNDKPDTALGKYVEEYVASTRRLHESFKHMVKKGRI